MPNIAVRTWDKMPAWGQFAIVGGTLLVGGITAKKSIDRYKEKKKLKQQKEIFEKSQIKIPVSDGKGNMTVVTFNSAVVAAKIHDAIHNNDIFGWTEDETEIVNQLKQVPKAYITEVEDNYMTLFNKNMKQEVIAALDNDEWQKVDYLFN